MNNSQEQDLRIFIENEIGQKLNAYTIDDDLFVELGLDSLGALALLAKIEKKYNIQIPNEELADTRTLRSILNYLS